MKKIVIIGAGPTGLTVAYEILSHHPDYQVVIYESNQQVGGLAKTISWNNNKTDFGGHRYFSTNKQVLNWWKSIVPLETKERKSSILFNGKRFAYPIELNYDFFSLLPWQTILKIMLDFIIIKIIPKKIETLEDFYINQFGQTLYSLFFKDYTHKVCGYDPKQIAPEWGYARVKGVSLLSAICHALTHIFRKREIHTEPSFTSVFYYPHNGSGALWNQVANQIKQMGGQIQLNSTVFQVDKSRCLHYSQNGIEYTDNADILISTMPLKDLCSVFVGIPPEIKNEADKIEYRNLVVIAVKLLKNSVSQQKLLACKDQWIYVQEQHILLGRIQLWDHWSINMNNHADNECNIGLEFFCSAQDPLWQLSVSS